MSVNEALLAAVATAFRGLLVERGETLATLRIAVMVAGSAPSARGNQAIPVVIPVDLDRSGDAVRQQVSVALRGAVEQVRSDGSSAASATTAGAALLRLRPVALRYRHYLRRQRRFHTLVSTLRGPSTPSVVGGHAVARIIPISTGELGNTTLQILALSSADELLVTVTADRRHGGDLERLAARLRRELAEVDPSAPG
ncbi:MAG: WS/DGAT domain-containing protein [Nakamurella sp.]